jgi:hypothetical protein
MKMKAKGKLAIAVAIIQHPAVQQAAREIGAAALRKTQEWWKARKERKKKAIKTGAAKKSLSLKEIAGAKKGGLRRTARRSPRKKV